MPDGAIATADRAGNAILWNKTQRRELQASNVPIWSITTSPDGTVIATGDEHGRVHLRNRKGQTLKTFKAHVGRIVAVRFNPSGTAIATAADDGAKLWDLSGQEIRTWVQNERVSDLAFRSDGKQVAIAAAGVVKLWDESGKLVRSFPVNRTEVHSLAFVGNQLITGGADGEVTLWQPSGERDFSFLAHSTGTYGLSLSPNGKQILTSGGNGTVRLWTLHGQQLGEWSGNKVAFGHNGQQIITADRTGTLSVIENETLEQLLGQSCLWMKDYLTNNPTVVERDRTLCQEFASK
jgi:WD40 repeat protein